MGAIRNLVVKLTGNTSGLQQSLGAAQSKLGSSLGAIQKTGGKFGSAMSGVFNSMAGMVSDVSTGLGSAAAAAGPVGIAIAVAGVVAVGALRKVVDAAQAVGNALTSAAKDTMPMYKEAQEAETKLVTVMRHRLGASDEMINAAIELANAEQLKGVTEADAVVAGQQQLATYLHSADALKTLTPAMADYAAQVKGTNATGGDFVTIATMLGKAMSGNTGIFARYGIVLTDAQTKLLKTGTEMQKATLLADLLSAKTGNMNQALGKTNIGVVTRLVNAWNDLKETIGAAFYNLLAAAYPVLMTLISMLSTAVKWVAAFTEALFDAAKLTRASTIGGFIVKTILGISSSQKKQEGSGSKLTDTNKRLAKSQDKVAKATSGAGKAAERWTASFDQLNKIQKAAAGGGAGGGVSDELEFPDVTSLEDLSTEIDKIKGKIKTAWEKFWSGEWIRSAITTAWTNLKQRFPILENVEIAVSTYAKIIGTWAEVGSKILGAWNAFRQGEISLSQFAGITVSLIIRGFVQTLQQIIAGVVKAFRLLITGSTGSGSGSGSGGRGGSSGADFNLNATAGLRVSLLDTTLAGTWDSIVGGAKKAVNKIIDQINVLTKKLNLLKVNIPWFFGGGTFSFNFPTIPRLAKGGIVDMPTIAMIGERGKEAVMPLENNTGWIDELAAKLGATMRPAFAGAGGGDTLVYIDSTQTAARVVKKNAWSGTKGASW
jgi:hypothetical protein